MSLKDLKKIYEIEPVSEFFLSERWKKSFYEDQILLAQTHLEKKCLTSLEAVVERKHEFIHLEATFKLAPRRFIFTEIGFTWQNGNTIENFYSHFECSCSYMGQSYCSHLAALYLHITQKLQKIEIQSDKSPVLNYSVKEWLDNIEKSCQVNESKRTKKPSNQSLAYCLHTNLFSNSRVYLTPRICTKTKKRTRINGYSMPAANPSNPARYMVEEDNFPCTLYHSLKTKYYDDYIPLENRETGRFLEAAIKTGRLYHLLHYDDSDQDALLINLAKTLQPKLNWEHQQNGMVNPVLGFSKDQIFIPTDPPFVFDTENLTLHPVSTKKYSRETLIRWINGPSIKANVIGLVAPQLKKIKLPQPKPFENKKLSASKPVPRLSLYRQNPFTHGGLHLSGQPEPIIGDLSFLYHGHEVKPLLENPKKEKDSFKVVQKNSILTIPRHFKEEANHIQFLKKTSNLVEAFSEYGDVALNYSNVFLPQSAPRDWDMEWALFMTSVVPQLEKKGWDINIQAESKVEFHNIEEEELDTELEELTEEGIDWFRFKASYLTPAGEKASLLPILSDYLKQTDISEINKKLTTLKGNEKMVLKDPESGAFISIGSRQFLSLAKNIYELFGEESPEEPLHRIQAANVADTLELNASQTLRALAELGNNLKNISTLDKPKVPTSLKADLRPYQLEGFYWLQFLAKHSLHGILADDMGLGKTLQTLTHIQAEVSGRRTGKSPSLVIAPTSVIGNWKAEAKKFTPNLKVLFLHGADRKKRFKEIDKHHLVLTTYGLLVRDFEILSKHQYHLFALDEAQYIKNPASKASKLACKIQSKHRISLSGTPIENHLGELWSQMRFLMPGLLGSQEFFRKHFRTPIEKQNDKSAQASLNRRVAPLILRRTKDEVASELPPKTHILHTIPLNEQQVDIYETVRASMDHRIREAISDKGLAKSQIIVLDALLKLRQICCHPQLLKIKAAQQIKNSAKLDFLISDLLPTLIEEGRKILLFSSFTSMLAIIEDHLKKQNIPYAQITGKTLKRQQQIEYFQHGEAQVFLISLKAGGTGLNLTAADTVIHYDPWWNPAAENQATDRAHRIGQTKPVFVHKLISEGTIEQRIQELQQKKSALVDALLTADTNKLKLDKETLNNLLAPL